MENKDATESKKSIYIGSAEMLKDGTIVMDLYAPEDAPAKGTTRLVYPPDNKEYQAMLQHLGEIVPGKKVGVLPWDDD